MDASDPGPPPNETVLADTIARLRRAMRRAARAQDPHGSLSVAQLELLSCLAELPGARPSRLAKELRLAPNSVTTLVNSLHGLDLIRRAGGTEDRRTVSLTLTETGAATVRQWQQANVGILRAALENLHPGWRHLLTSSIPALQELVLAIDAQAETPHHSSSEATGMPGR